MTLKKFEQELNSLYAAFNAQSNDEKVYLLLDEILYLDPKYSGEILLEHTNKASLKILEDFALKQSSNDNFNSLYIPLKKYYAKNGIYSTDYESKLSLLDNFKGMNYKSLNHGYDYSNDNYLEKILKYKEDQFITAHKKGLVKL